MALQKCGYATDPKYQAKLIQIIEQYKLYEYDNEVSHFAAKAYEFVTQNNISDGSRAKDPATREEIWVMIYRIHELINKQ